MKKRNNRSNPAKKPVTTPAHFPHDGGSKKRKLHGEPNLKAKSATKRGTPKRDKSARGNPETTEPAEQEGAIESPSSEIGKKEQSRALMSRPPDAAAADLEIPDESNENGDFAMLESILLKDFPSFHRILRTNPKHGIREMRDLLISFARWRESPGGIDDRGPVFRYPTMLSEKYIAWERAAQIAETELRELLQTSFDALLDVIKHSGRSGAGAVRILLDAVLPVLAGMKRLMSDATTRELFAAEARHRFEFPALLSIFTRENTDSRNFTLNELSLGKDLPFKIDRRRPLNAFNAWAMRIVVWINHQRREASSVYLKVEPGLGDSSITNAAWENALSFHLDYFQSPGASRWRKLAKEYNLQTDCQRDQKNDVDCYEEYRQSKIELFKIFGAPVQDITEVPEFRVILASGRDKNVTDLQTLYNRVKQKILNATRSMIH